MYLNFSDSIFSNTNHNMTEKNYNLQKFIICDAINYLTLLITNF